MPLVPCLQNPTWVPARRPLSVPMLPCTACHAGTAKYVIPGATIRRRQSANLSIPSPPAPSCVPPRFPHGPRRRRAMVPLRHVLRRRQRQRLHVPSAELRPQRRWRCGAGGALHAGRHHALATQLHRCVLSYFVGVPYTVYCAAVWTVQYSPPSSTGAYCRIL